MWDATKLAVELMETARGENPRGDLYRQGQYPVDRLVGLLEQNWEEVKIALRTGEDVGPKLGDLLNYAAFIAHNALHPPDVCPHIPKPVTVYGIQAGVELVCERCGIAMKAVPA
jgi:hypothetical protein